MKLKPYPEYKDSGIQWIGEIPEGWNNYKLKHVVNEFVAGGIPRSDDEKFWAHDEHGIPWVNIGDMTNNEIVTETKKEITVEGQADKGLRILKDGTLLYSIFASLGKVAVLGIDATTNQAISGLIISKKIDTIFLKYYLKNLEEPIITLSNANTQNNLNSTIVKNIEIAIPSLLEQTTIASFFDERTARIDALIEKDKKLIALLKEKRTALINHVVTKGLDPNVKLKDSGIPWIGEIPEGWEVVPLNKYLQSFVDYRGATPEKTNEGIFLVTGKNIKEGKINYELSKEYVFEDQYEEIMHRGKPKIGDLLFTTEAPLGEVANVDYEKIALAQRIIKIRGKKQKLDNYYLKYYIMTQLFQSHLQSLATGSTALGLKASNWCFLKLIVPPLSEQLQIVQYLDNATAKIDKTIKRIEKKIKLLEEYKKSLIHHVVTGKVDVRKSEI